MSSIIENIIQNHYLKIKGHSSLYTDIIDISASILSEMYKLYEDNENKHLLLEINFFLEVKDSLRHMVNILKNSGEDGRMTIKEAILLEYKSIHTKKNTMSTLLTVCQEIFIEINLSDKPHKQNEIVDLIINNMIDYRLVGLLDVDGCFLLDQKDYFIPIQTIVENRHQLNIAIHDLYKNLATRKNRYMMDNFKEIHKHLDHSSKSIFDELQCIKKIIDDSSDLSSISTHDVN